MNNIPHIRLGILFYPVHRMHVDEDKRICFSEVLLWILYLLLLVFS